MNEELADLPLARTLVACVVVNSEKGGWALCSQLSGGA